MRLLFSIDGSKIAFSSILNLKGKNHQSRLNPSKNKSRAKQSGPSPDRYSHLSDTKTNTNAKNRMAKDNRARARQNSTLDWTWIDPHGSAVIQSASSKFIAFEWTSFLVAVAVVVVACLPLFLIIFQRKTFERNSTNTQKAIQNSFWNKTLLENGFCYSENNTPQQSKFDAKIWTKDETAARC